MTTAKRRYKLYKSIWKEIGMSPYDLFRGGSDRKATGGHVTRIKCKGRPGGMG